MSGITRDFSQQSVQELRDIIRKNLQDNQWGFFDWFDDTFLMQELNIKNYINNVNEYHAKMIDKHNMGSAEFDRILERVHTVDENYSARINSLVDQAKALQTRIEQLTKMIDPSVITANPGDFARLADGIDSKYQKVKVQSEAKMKQCEASMPVLYDKQWYENVVDSIETAAVGITSGAVSEAVSVAGRLESEAASVASGAEGVAVSIVRDAIEGVTAPVLLATELVRYGPGNIQFRDINTFRKQLDYLDQQFTDHCVPDKTWYYGGRIVGDTACVVAGAGMTVVGISTIIGGFTVTAGGVLATATGVGAVIGVPTIAVSGVAVAEGALVTAGGVGIIYASGRNLFDDVPKFMQEISKGGGESTLKYKTVKTMDAKQANQWFTDNVDENYHPPYTPGTKVDEIELSSKGKFVRVYDGEKSHMAGQWLMREEDVKGLSAQEIKDKYALENLPKYMCDAEVDEGTHLRMGEANAIEGWGKGKGLQFDLMGNRAKFSNERLIN